MHHEAGAMRLGPDSAEAVIGQIAPTIHALEAAHGCEITVEVKAERLWLLPTGFPLPPGRPAPEVAISLVWNGETVSLYQSRHLNNHQAAVVFDRASRKLGRASYQPLLRHPDWPAVMDGLGIEYRYP